MYGIKVILKSRIENKADTIFFEEIILTVKEENENLAIKKAEEYAKGYCKSYINACGEKVLTDIYDISDAFEAFNEDENGVREVYSKFISLEGEE
ncbi:MAG: DUF4288 domain-containing protein [Lachnospiraceae bacterium]|nr:DUF4288 domain-containing protein [Lachnospiraceae bacterium]